jgi:hypothetical protein
MRGENHAVLTGKIRNAYNILIAKPKRDDY